MMGRMLSEVHLKYQFQIQCITILSTDASGEKLLKAAVQQLHLLARAYHRVLKLARTIVGAIQYRPRVGQ